MAGDGNHAPTANGGGARLAESNRTPTEEMYGDLQRAYKLFNSELFDDSLPECLITLRARGRTNGYFSEARFVHPDGGRTAEIALNPERFYTRTIEACLSTLVHELAHQWFGDAVSPREWDDIWLNEGFATYLEWVYEGEHDGDDPATRFAALYREYADDPGFWRPAPHRLPNARYLFDYNAVYTRGAMTLEVLRQRVGDDDFWQIVRTWVRRYDGRSASTEQFVALAQDVSGQDLSRLFTDWLDTPRYPAGY